MRRSFAASVGFHLLIVVLAVVGLPSTPRVPNIAETPVMVDLVSLSESSAPSPGGNASRPDPEPMAMPKPPADEARQEPPDATPPSPPRVEPKPEVMPPPEPEVAVTPPPPEPSPEPQVEESAPQPTVRPAPPKPEVAPPEPEPETEPEPVVAEAARPAPLPVAERKPTPPERPREVAEEASPVPVAEPAPAQQTKPTLEEATDFAAVSKAVRGLETPTSKRAPTPEGPSLEDRLARALGTGGGSGGDAPSAQAGPVTSGEIDAVRRQIERCWNLPSGVKESDNLIVAVRVTMNADGTPQSARVEDSGAMQANPHYRAAAESAVRAVLNPRCHPFKLPPEKFQTWKTMVLVFNPKEMFGT